MGNVIPTLIKQAGGWEWENLKTEFQCHADFVNSPISLRSGNSH